jgi:hypothetical protein
MTKQTQHHLPSFSVPRNQPLIGIPVVENGQEMVRYFTDEEEAERVASGVDEALSLAGAWSDLDEEEMQQALDRIRHESKPTPPIKL